MKESGEPPRNRTENPQIKSWVETSKPLDFLTRCLVRVAQRGIRRHIDRIPAGPQLRAANPKEDWTATDVGPAACNRRYLQPRNGAPLQSFYALQS
jgi:hypothetical protein